MEECGEQIDCETCPIRTAREGLSAHNRTALEAFDLLARRIVMDFHLAPLVFDVLGIRVSQPEARALIHSLDLIYDMRCPVTRETAHGG